MRKGRETRITHPQLTSIYACADNDPEQAQHPSPDTLTRLLRVIVRQRHGSNFGVWRPVVDDTGQSAYFVVPVVCLHAACLAALAQILAALHQGRVERVVLCMFLDDRLQTVYGLRHRHGEDGFGGAIRV